MIVEHAVDLSGDCVWAACPPEAPYPIGCDIDFVGGDSRRCVAYTPGDTQVYFKKGNVCNAGHLTGSLVCSSCPGGPLNAGNCPINKPDPRYVQSWQACPVGDNDRFPCPQSATLVRMALRIRGLSHLDPRTVPLPVGTEVCTRVDRIVDTRTIPQGAVGRVHAVQDDQIDVHLVGIGVVRYARDEVHPRKVGQMRFAQRRHDAWQALRPCIVLESTVGSRAWGLSTASSDHDVRGVFALPASWSFGLAEPPDTLVSADGSATYWEIGKAIRQALRADPNTLEMLFVPDSRAVDPIGAWLLEARDAFVSAEIYGSFGRYALSQLKRLEQASQLASLWSTVFAWLREDPPPTLDDITQRLASLDPRAAPTRADAEHRARNHIKQLYRSLYDQGQIPARELDALVAFARQQAADLDLARELRPKNAYNLLRLIATAIDWLETGRARLEVEGEMRERLLSIKEGRVPLTDVLRDAEALTPALERARKDTLLPLRADIARVDGLLKRVREELARRWIERQPGPWGAEAPPAPEARWDDQGEPIEGP